MSKNIKEIGKELLGKSLNSFHRKTGLTQLEKNNEMQDGILDGILSQVDDAYIEKTEQSNVMHLDGSGDGVVVLDSVEGNTMVNLIKTNMKNFEVVDNNAKNFDVVNLKPSTTYTFVAHLKDVCSTNMWLARFHFNKISDNSEFYINVAPHQIYTSNSVVRYSFTTPNNDYVYKIAWALWNSTLPSGEKMSFYNALVLEGDWTDKEVPIDLQGLQSSFEEQIEDDKYKIEILSNNGNIFDINAPIEPYISSSCKVENESITVSCDSLGWYRSTMTLNGLKPNTTYYLKYEYESISGSPYKDVNIHDANGYKEGSNANALPLTNGTFTTPNGCRSIKIRFYCGSNTTFGTIKYKNIMISENNMNYIPQKQNKIKLLINEPLRAVDDAKDRLCVKDGKLTIERNTFLQVLNGQEIWNMSDSLNTSNTTRYYTNTLTIPMTLNSNGISDKIPYITGGGKDNMTCIYVHSTVNRIDIRRLNSDNRWSTLEQLKTWLRNNNITLVLKRLEPIYEEVLNEYGEPILLEGYENGTLYIDSAIIPTTTVRYTPKMESFKTLKEVENNNIMLTNDVNDNIIPYMMDVDLMIMEKEMALMSHKNIRKMEELDMTSMQKRTQDMLERLIKGKTLTEQECKTRVTTYLNAGKITDEQAEELMLVISEVYA